MKKKMIISTVIILGIIYGYWYLFLMVYEVKVMLTPAIKELNKNEVVTISIIPINSSGKRIYIREIAGDFIFESGNELVTILEKSDKRGILILKAGELSGELKIMVKPVKSLLPTRVTLAVNADL